MKREVLENINEIVYLPMRFEITETAAGPAAAPTAATPAAGAHKPELIKPAIGPCRSDGQLSFNIRSSQANLCNPSRKSRKVINLFI